MTHLRTFVLAISLLTVGLGAEPALACCHGAAPRSSVPSVPTARPTPPPVNLPRVAPDLGGTRDSINRPGRAETRPSPAAQPTPPPKKPPTTVASDRPAPARTDVGDGGKATTDDSEIVAQVEPTPDRVAESAPVPLTEIPIARAGMGDGIIDLGGRVIGAGVDLAGRAWDATVGPYWNAGFDWLGEKLPGFGVNSALRTAGGVGEAISGWGLLGAGVLAGGTATLGGAVAVVGGGLVILHGLDTLIAAGRDMWSGQFTSTLTSSTMQVSGVSRGTADFADAGLSIAGALVAGLGTVAVRTSQVIAAEVGGSPGVWGTIKAMWNHEVGQRALSNAAYDTVKNLPGAETALGRAAIFSEQAASQTLWQRAGGWISGTWEAFNPYGKVLPTGPAPVATAVASPGGAASTYFSATWNGIFGGGGK